MLAKDPITLRRTKAYLDKGADLHVSGARPGFERGASARGSGIGLHLALVLARADGGNLRVDPTGRPRFALSLPLYDGTLEGFDPTHATDT